MTMQPELWSINALSTELGIDRRTLSKKLATLPAAQSKKVGKRIEKRWMLADVVEHLNRLNNLPEVDDDMLSVSGYRLLHILSIPHFVEWAFTHAWEDWLTDCVDAGIGRTGAEESYKEAYGMMLHMMKRYISQDAFDRYFRAESGSGLDELQGISRAGKPYKPLEPDQIPYQVPQLIKEISNGSELKQFECKAV